MLKQVSFFLKVFLEIYIFLSKHNIYFFKRANASIVFQVIYFITHCHMSLCYMWFYYNESTIHYNQLCLENIDKIW